MNILKYYVRRMLGLPVHYYFERAAVPAATHLPVLIGLGTLFPVRTVLEFGAGSFSTLSFLDRSLFPSVERVVSFETDPDWKRRVEAQAGEDERLTVTLIDTNVPRAAAGCNFSTFDLVFVDNGPSERVRAETIKEVVAHIRDRELVVIHDFEYLSYQRAAKAARHRFCFDGYCPHTGVVWNDREVGSRWRATFRRMNRAFARSAKIIEPDDTDRWKHIVADIVAPVGAFNEK
jgi:predicted O-methyltransferase YrrM